MILYSNDHTFPTTIMDDSTWRELCSLINEQPDDFQAKAAAILAAANRRILMHEHPPVNSQNLAMAGAAAPPQAPAYRPIQNRPRPSVPDLMAEMDAWHRRHQRQQEDMVAAYMNSPVQARPSSIREYTICDDRVDAAAMLQIPLTREEIERRFPPISAADVTYMGTPLHGDPHFIGTDPGASNEVTP